MEDVVLERRSQLELREKVDWLVDQGLDIHERDPHLIFGRGVQRYVYENGVLKSWQK